MTEEKTIQFSCPVCKSVWGAKASMAGTRKACPKCKTEIIVPSPAAVSAAPKPALASKEKAKPAEKKPLAVPLLLWIGIPAVLVVAAIIIGISMANSRRDAAPPVAEAPPSKAKEAVAPEKKEIPAKKEEPPADDPKWLKIVENFLKSNENKCTITKTYPTESIVGAYYRTGGKENGTWFPVDRPLSFDELAKASSSASQAKDLGELKNKPLDQITLDDLVKIQNEELKKIPPDELRKLGLEPPKAAKPEDLKKAEDQELQSKKEEEKIYERIRMGRAIRVEYDADEGFGRIKHRDEVFVIDAEGNIVHRLGIDDFRLGKPQEK